jgi:hypothetical protein
MLVSTLGAVGGEVRVAGVYDSGWSSTQASCAPAIGARATSLSHANYHSTVGHSSARPHRFEARTVEPQPLFQSSLAHPSSGHGKLRLVAFDAEAEGPRVRLAQRGSASLRSVVVQEDGHSRGYRIAQDNLEDDLREGFEAPFGAEEQLPPQQADDDWFGGSSDDEPTIDPLPPLEGTPNNDIKPLKVRDPFDEPRDTTRSPSDRTAPKAPQRGGLRDVTPEDIGPPRTRPTTNPASKSKQDERAKVQQNCAEELAELKASRIAEIDLQIRPDGSMGEDFPYECGIDDGTPFAGRSWAEITYMWKASALCHKPLYFEDVQLERYGHSWGPVLQPIVSGAHFFGRLPVLPYCMGLQAPGECVYTLGHYRPGSCAPYLIEPIPFTWRAAAFQGAAWTGGVFAIP